MVSEDIVKQVHRLKNEMFVMSGKIKGKTLLPIPEHLGSLDGTLESMERCVGPAASGCRWVGKWHMLDPHPDPLFPCRVASHVKAREMQGKVVH